MKLLIVDDSKSMRSFLHHLVGKLRFDVLEARDGCEALEVLKKHPEVELALVDWEMPRMNGLEFIKAIRKSRSHDGIKLMMVATQHSMDRVAAALAAGACEFLMKPVSEASLNGKLRVLGVIE